MGKFDQLRRLIAAGIILSIFLLSCAPAPFSTEDSQTLASGEIPATVESIPAAPQSLPEASQEIRLTPLQLDDYLTNPGMGWQDGPQPFGIMNFPETVSYANRREIAWSELNPAPNIYNWYALDAQFDEAVRAGKQFSFRIYTVVGEGYDGNKVPEWVIEAGARLMPSGEPDYSNCIYQTYWGEFVNELIRVYDGNPDIAFIDISGYGNFNEWNWDDTQTEWDDQWTDDYASGAPSAASFETLDGQARRRLADIFIGGSFENHACKMPDGTIAYVNYSYPGFKKTQLLMPYAGIVQSSQYVSSRRSDIGFRYDCLGRDGQHVFDKIGEEISHIWISAPVVYELCKPSEVDVDDARWLLQTTHASLVHNNNWAFSREALEDLIRPVGYRFMLSEMDYKFSGRQVYAQMKWQNIGLAPSYPKMGQEFTLNFCLVDGSGKLVLQDPVPVDISRWLPTSASQSEPPTNTVIYAKQLPSFVTAGRYLVGVSIIDNRTNKPIQLAFSGRDANGIYLLFSTEIQ